MKRQRKRNEIETIKAIGYIRVSRLKHHKNHVSPDTQKEAIENYCKAMGWELAAIFEDLDRSGYKRKAGKLNYEDRPGLLQALEYVKTHSIQKLVVWKFSRLGRRIREAHEIIDTLENVGCDVVCTSLNIDTGTPTGRLVRNIMIDFDEFTSEELGETIYENKAVNAERGRWNGGNVPYGLKWLPDKKEFVEHEETFRWLQLIFDLAERGWLPSRIAAYLHEQGAPPPREKWTDDSVRYILRNPIYVAMPVWDGEARPSRYQCFIPKQQFEKVQAMLDRNSKLAPRTLGSQHFLTPLLRCGICGSRMDIKYNGTDNWKRRRYHCSRKYALLKEERCNTPYYDADSLEEAVVTQLRSIACQPEFLDQILTEAIESVPVEAIKKEISTLEAQLAVLVRAENELFDDCYVKKLIPQEQFLRQNERLQEKRQEIEDRLQQLRRELSHDSRQLVEAYKRELEQFTRLWDSATSEEKREIVASLVDEVIVQPERATMKLYWAEVGIPTYERRKVVFFKTNKEAQ